MNHFAVCEMVFKLLMVKEHKSNGVVTETHESDGTLALDFAPDGSDPAKVMILKKNKDSASLTVD